VVGDVLVWLTPGMVALSVVYVLARAFYARQDTVTPVIAGVISIAACVGLGYPASRWLDVAGLGMVTSLTNVLNAVLLLWLLKRQVGQLDGRRIVLSLLRVLPGCVALGVICWLGAGLLERRLGTTGELAKLLTVAVPMGAGGAAFLGLCVALRTEELSSAWRLVARRRPGHPTPQADAGPDEVARNVP